MRKEWDDLAIVLIYVEPVVVGRPVEMVEIIKTVGLSGRIDREMDDEKLNKNSRY